MRSSLEPNTQFITIAQADEKLSITHPLDDLKPTLCGARIGGGEGGKYGPQNGSL